MLEHGNSIYFMHNHMVCVPKSIHILCCAILFLRYGVYLGLVQDNSGTVNDLHMLLSTIKLQLKAQQYSNKPTLGKFH